MEDQVQLVVRGSDGGYLLIESTSKKLHLPTTKLRESEDFKTAAQRCLKQEIFIKGEIQGILKIQYCKYAGGVIGKLNTHNYLVVTFLVEKPSGQQQSTGHSSHQWLKLEQLRVKPNYILDEGTNKLLQQIQSGKGFSISPPDLIEREDVSKMRAVTHKRQESEPMEQRKGGKEKSLEEQVLELAGYGESELEQIADEFVKQCGSRTSQMRLPVFTSILTKLGFQPELCTQCFNALRSSGSKSDSDGLTLLELQVGLCCLDPMTPHGGVCGQLRCQMIYNFYTLGNTSLTFENFKIMIRDIHNRKSVTHSEEELQKMVETEWKVFDVSQDKGVPLNIFLNVVGQLKFRGTSVLFRLPRPPITRTTPIPPDAPQPLSPAPSPNISLNRKIASDGALTSISEPIKREEETPEISDPKKARVDTLDSATSNESEESMDFSHSDEVSGDSFKSPPSIVLEDSTEPISDGEGELESLPGQSYTIATHFVKVRRSGTLSDVTTIWDLAGTECLSGSLDSIIASKPGFDRLPSINAFDRTSKSNEMLSGLRYFEHALKDNGRGKPKPSFSWGAVDMGSVARCFQQLCVKAVDVFQSEPRLLEVNSPTYVLGDLHGNFHDLVCFEKVLWRMGPVLTPATFLFLGDYVDRGPHGFEVVAYLLAQKLLMPSKFQLIRGNHEIRAVQETFSYKDECVEKFGPELGLEVWESTNSAFDVMPIAAVIDKKVFCVHGGIPVPSLGDGLLSSIDDIPTHLPDPMDQSQLAWEIMWNDPIRSEEITDPIEESLEENSGFIDNFARGTAHMFSANALVQFLKRNSLSHVIRAHECKAAGFQIQQHGRLLTVFSSSHYCGATNEAACVLIDSKKIRTIRLDTT